MKNINQTEIKQLNEVEGMIIKCKTKFNDILDELLAMTTKEANDAKKFIFKQIMELGLMLLSLYFSKFNKGNYGKTLKTAEGEAVRGATSDRKYFSIFDHPLLKNRLKELKENAAHYTMHNIKKRYNNHNFCG